MLKGFALAGSHPSLVAIRPNVKLLADVRAAIAKLESEGNPGDGGKGGSAEIDTAISQLVSQAISADRVVDIFAEAGFADPDISILSNEFLDDLTKSETPNLQVSLLKKMLNDEIRKMRKTNLVKSRRFSDLLDKTIARYNNRNLTTAEIIAELVELAKSLRDDAQATSNSGLSVAEVAFYDAVTQNGAALTTMGDETLKKIAKELVDAVKESATIDWTLKQSVKAAMRAKIKRLLAKYDYPPDLEEEAIELVLEQAELLADSITSL
jgi:type I restriction enzyme R subunit